MQLTLEKFYVKVILMDMKERRRYVRINESIRISYRIVQGSLKTDSQCIDISEGGIRLPVFQEMEVGTILELRVHISEFSHPLFLIGKVVWIRKKPVGEFRFVAGIRFLRARPLRDRRVITTFIKQLRESKLDVEGEP